MKALEKKAFQGKVNFKPEFNGEQLIPILMKNIVETSNLKALSNFNN